MQHNNTQIGETTFSGKSHVRCQHMHMTGGSRVHSFLHYSISFTSYKAFVFYFMCCSDISILNQLVSYNNVIVKWVWSVLKTTTKKKKKKKKKKTAERTQKKKEKKEKGRKKKSICT